VFLFEVADDIVGQVLGPEIDVEDIGVVPAGA
jgi:hypothetical protein